MKLNTATVLTDLDGLAIQDVYMIVEEKKRIQKERDLTIGHAISGALVSRMDKELTPTEVSDRYGLAMGLRNNKEVTLTSEEVTLCKNVVAKAFQPLISGQIIMILEK